jgi:hypothetical protein
MDAPDQLVADLLRWLQGSQRQYSEVMDAWRTNCPRLPVWEDAVDAGFVDCNRDTVSLTDAGKQWLSKRCRDRAVGRSS